MLSIEHVCRGGGRPDALLALTGCRVGMPACDRSVAAPVGLPIYLSGSDGDPWIPLHAMLEAARSLGSQGTNLRS